MVWAVAVYTPCETSELRESLALVSGSVIPTAHYQFCENGPVRTSRKRLQLLLLFVAGSLVVLGLSPQAHAASYALTTIPARTQESNTPGVVLALNVTGATVGTTYKFTWTVTDPSGAARSAANQTVAPATSFVISAAYPSRFGTSINYVGNYTINVQQNNPNPIASVATGKFQVGLTDSLSYERTFSVSIKARGYNNNSPVTVNISHAGTPAPGYPTTVTADGTGSLATTWVIPFNVSTGLWTVSLTGSPTKVVPDTQTITVYPTNATIANLFVGQQVLARTQIQSFTFTANYLSGLTVQTGSAQINVTESDGTTSFLVSANYNFTLAAYHATYLVLPSDETGPWTATIGLGEFDDGYGNGGPLVRVTSSFTINPANVTISQLNIGQAVVIKGQTQTFSFTAKYNNGPSVQIGSARVRITETDGTTSFYTTATYNSTLGVFYTTYRIPSDGETGAWVATLDPGTFNDGYGNLGPSTSVVRAFTIAFLSVSASIASQTYTPGQVIPIYARVTYPDGSLFTTGNVTAAISSSTVQIASVQLVYVPGQSQWVGTYTVGSNDPSGVWLVTVQVSDSFANTGQETISAIVNVPPQTPPPVQQPLDLYYFILTAVLIGSGGSGLMLLRRINPTRGGFDEFFKLIGGEISPGTTLLILGDPGSGTSTLGQELIHHQLASGKPCGLLTYDAFPSEVARAMRSFGWDPAESMKNGTFKILDCYSALAGAENAPIRDPVDFTEISIQVSTMIENATPAPITLVVDSITPVFNSAPARTVVNFLRVLSAKIKNNNGILILTGARGSIPEEVKSNLEGTADGVIELSVTRSGQSVIRTLTVKRLAGRRVSPGPAEFDIVAERGMLFRKLRIPLGIISPK